MTLFSEAVTGNKGFETAPVPLGIVAHRWLTNLRPISVRWRPERRVGFLTSSIVWIVAQIFRPAHVSYLLPLLFRLSVFTFGKVGAFNCSRMHTSAVAVGHHLLFSNCVQSSKGGGFCCPDLPKISGLDGCTRLMRCYAATLSGGFFFTLKLQYYYFLILVCIAPD